MIHIWLPYQQAPLRVWQETTQTWQLAENWQEVAALISLQQSSKPKHSPACLYFPSLHLLKIQSELPAAQLKSLGESGRQFLFEHISIASVEDLQIKSQTMNDQTTLFALHAADRDAWMNAAQLAGISVVALLPDFMLVPTVTQATEPRQTAVFYQDADTQLLRYGENLNQGMAVSHLPIQLSKLPTIETLYIAGDNTTLSSELLQQLEMLPHLTTHLVELAPIPAMDAPRQFLNFAVIKRDTKVAPYLKTIAAVLFAALLTGLLVDGLRWFYYQKAEVQAKNLLKQQFEQWFPNERYNTQLSMKRQLSGKLINEQSNGQSNVMATLSSIQPVLRQYQISARQLSFQNNRLQLQLVAKDNDTLNKAVTTLNTQGIAAKLGAVSQNNALTAANTATDPNAAAMATAIDAGGATATVEITL